MFVIYYDDGNGPTFVLSDKNDTFNWAKLFMDRSRLMILSEESAEYHIFMDHSEVTLWLF